MQQHNIRQGAGAAPEVPHASQEGNGVITAPRSRDADGGNQLKLQFKCRSCQVQTFYPNKVWDIFTLHVRNPAGLSVLVADGASTRT